jgi:enoyl-CoA hydratase/carnithine racemase
LLLGEKVDPEQAVSIGLASRVVADAELVLPGLQRQTPARMEGATSGHRFLNPEGMTPARGFSHGAIPAGGKTFYIAGQTGHYEDSADLVSMTIYTTDVEGTVWSRSAPSIGRFSASTSPRWP